MNMWTDRQTDRQTDIQTDRQADRQTDSHYEHMDRQTGRHIVFMNIWTDEQMGIFT